MTNAYSFLEDLNRLPVETRHIVCQVAQAYTECTIDSDQYSGLQYALQLITHIEELQPYSSAEIVNYLMELDLIHPAMDLYHRVYHD